MPLRHISTSWDRLICPIEIVTGGGIGLNGLTVELKIRRRSDGMWFNPALPGWQAGAAIIVVPQPDVVNLPGYYEYFVPFAYLDQPNGKNGYILQFRVNTQNILEHVDVTTRPTDESISEQVWTDDLENLGFIGLGNDTTGANIVWRLITGLLACYSGSPSLTQYIAGAIGAGGKFYHTAGPVAADNPFFAGKLAVYRPTGSNAGRMVRVSNVGNDGSDYFTLADMQGNAISPTAVNDILIVANSNDFAIQELLDQPMSATAALGSYADLLKRMLGLRQSNMRLVQTAWNAAGAVTAGYILLYNTASDANTDVSPWPLAVGRYDFTATYDGSLRLTNYVSVRTS